LWSYSNSAYWVAGAVAARVAGIPYEEAARKLVLGPAGLRSTAFEPTDISDGHRAVGTIVRPGREDRAAGIEYPRVRRPSGGLWTTAADLLRFADAVIAERPPVGRAIMQSALTPTVAGVGTTRWGAGWRVLPHLGAIGHTGTYGGFESEMTIVPERRVACVAFGNSSHSAAAVRQITSMVLESLGVPASVPAGRAEPPPAQLERLAGWYLQPEQAAEVTVVGRKLRVRAFDYDWRRRKYDAEEEALASPAGGTTFDIESGPRGGTQFDFVVRRDGSVRFLRFDERVAEPVDTVPDVLRV
ncbi:MAG: serine hydrolase domain-containing protein, partial [Catenulispora sp.]